MVGGAWFLVGHPCEKSLGAPLGNHVQPCCHSNKELPANEAKIHKGVCVFPKFFYPWRAEDEAPVFLLLFSTLRFSWEPSSDSRFPMCRRRRHVNGTPDGGRVTSDPRTGLRLKEKCCLMRQKLDCWRRASPSISSLPYDLRVFTPFFP